MRPKRTIAKHEPSGSGSQPFSYVAEELWRIAKIKEASLPSTTLHVSANFCNLCATVNASQKATGNRAATEAGAQAGSGAIGLKANEEAGAVAGAYWSIRTFTWKFNDNHCGCTRRMCSSSWSNAVWLYFDCKRSECLFVCLLNWASDLPPFHSLTNTTTPTASCRPRHAQ